MLPSLACLPVESIESIESIESSVDVDRPTDASVIAPISKAKYAEVGSVHIGAEMGADAQGSAKQGCTDEKCRPFWVLFFVVVCFVVWLTIHLDERDNNLPPSSPPLPPLLPGG